MEDRRERRAAVPAFDFVALDATHLLYALPVEHAIFQPAPNLTSSHHILRSREDLEIVRKPRNGCHFADEQIGHVLDDLKARGDLNNTIVVLTEHVAIDVPTVHMDIAPTLLNALGFDADVLYTHGRSLLGIVEYRPMLSLCEHLSKPPRYRALVTDTYVSRWRYTARRYLFSGVQGGTEPGRRRRVGERSARPLRNGAGDIINSTRRFPAAATVRTEAAEHP